MFIPNNMKLCNKSTTLSFFGDIKTVQKPIALSPQELRVLLETHREQIAELALAQPLFAARHDDIEWATDLVAGYLNRISYDKDDPDCQQYIRVAAWDYVLSPIANRVL